jgi:hypothetical protein
VIDMEIIERVAMGNIESTAAKLRAIRDLA